MQEVFLVLLLVLEEENQYNRIYIWENVTQQGVL
jgi:hypothetical protein